MYPPLLISDIIEQGQKDMSKPAITANEQQVGGDHYKTEIQPWDYIVANNIGYMEGNIIKYVSRWKEKGGVEDLKKAQHYLWKLIETAEK